jgi:hypothetical protein
MASKKINLFEKGGKIFEDHAAFGCDEKCVCHFFVSVCLVCNHDFTDDYEIKTRSLRLASLHFKKHSNCSGYGGPKHGGFHYCRVVENGKLKMSFHSHLEDEDDEELNDHGHWFEA